VSHWGRLLAIGGSLSLHAGALAALLLLAASLRQPEPLFVDLTAGAIAGDEGHGSGAEPSPPRAKSTASPAKQGGHRASAPAAMPAPVPAETRPAEVAPLPAPVPPPSPPREAAAPEPAATAAPTRDSGAEQARPAAPAPTDGGGGKGVASDAPAGAGRAGGTGGGSRLALAGPGAARNDVPAEFGPYLAALRRRIQELVVYPLAARRQGLAGRVEVEVVLEPTGRVRDVTMVGSSTHPMLDDAALEAVRSLPPVPLPENLPRRPLRVRLPIVFDLR
jgi:periplasmic protein TonB